MKKQFQFNYSDEDVIRILRKTVKVMRMVGEEVRLVKPKKEKGQNETEKH